VFHNLEKPTLIWWGAHRREVNSNVKRAVCGHRLGEAFKTGTKLKIKQNLRYLIILFKIYESGK
jgi:hypothetical protein